MPSILPLIILPLSILSEPVAALCAPVTAVAGIRSSTKCGVSRREASILRSSRPTNGYETQIAETVASSSTQSESTSHIVSITSRNVAGMKSEENNDEIVIRFDSSHTAGTGFVAVTGESGSGKSLLVSKAIDLVTGGKAVASLLPSSGDELAESLVEMGT